MLDRSKWSGRVNPLAFLQALRKCVMSGTTNCMCFNIQGNPLHKYDGSNYSSVIVKRLGVMSLGPLQSTGKAFPLQLHRCKKTSTAKASKALSDCDPTVVFMFYPSLSSPGLRNPRAVPDPTISIRDGRVPPWSQLPMPCSGARDPPASQVAWKGPGPDSLGINWWCLFLTSPEWATMSRIYGKNMIDYAHHMCV